MRLLLTKSGKILVGIQSVSYPSTLLPLILLSTTIQACGPRHTEKRAEDPAPVPRSVVSIKQPSWGGDPNVSGKSGVVLPSGQEAPGKKAIQIFFSNMALTASDGEDHAVDEQITIWFSPKSSAE